MEIHCLGVYHKVLKNLALFNEKEIKLIGKMTSFSNQSKTPKESSSTPDNPSKDYSGAPSEDIVQNHLT